MTTSSNVEWDGDEEKFFVTVPPRAEGEGSDRIDVTESVMALMADAWANGVNAVTVIRELEYSNPYVVELTHEPLSDI